MNKKYLPYFLLFFFTILSGRFYAQQGCNAAAIRAAFAAAGHYTELVVNGEPCSLYFVDTQTGDATTGQANAATLGANLCVLNDATENANVSAAINLAGWLNGGAVMWIGYHRTGAGDNFPFVTLDGTPLVYTNWNPGEPNNNGFGGGANSPGCYNGLTGCTFCVGSAGYRCTNGEQCVEMYASGFWNDYPCDQNSMSLVEVNLCPQVTGPDDTLLCGAGATLNFTTSTILGSQPYTYAWTPGGQTTSGITVNPAASTTYTFTATDRYSCYSTKTIQVTVVNVPTPVVTANPTSICVNQSTSINYTGAYSGTAVFHWGFSGGTVVGASPPYSVSWPTAGPENITLFVTDQGCTTPTATTTVTVNSYPVANAGPDVQVCSGASVTLGVAPAGGVTYSWTPPLALSNPAISNPVFSAVNPGNTTLSYPYALAATSNNCTSYDTAIVTLYPPIDNSFTVNPTTVCVGDNALITYTGTNSAGATYTWNFAGGTVVSGAGQGPYTVNWAVAGNPSVTLSVNENSCTAPQSSVAVTVNAIPVANAGPDVSFCSGATANLGSAPVGGVTYSWSPVLGLSSSTVSNPTITGVNPGATSLTQNYTVTATENGCTASDVVAVTMYAPIVTTFSINPASVCINANTVITYTGTNSAGATYTWGFAGANIVSGAGQGPYTVNWSIAGNPNVTLNVIENGCPGIATSQVVNVGNPPVADAGADQTVCSGGTVQLGAAAVGVVTYSWSPVADLSNANIAQPSFSLSNTTSAAQNLTYTVIANDNGCTAFDQVIVTVNPPAVIAITPSGPLEFCAGGSVTLSLATPYSTYLWSDGSSTAQITESASGTFAVSVADASGCQSIGTPVTVIVDPNPTVSLVQKTDEQCYGSGDGSLTVAAGAGTSPFTFTWSTVPAQNTSAITSLVAGPYSVTVTDSKNCTVSDQYVIAPGPFFALILDSVTNVSCFGLSDGAAYMSVDSGTAPFSYLWSNGNTALINNNLIAGSYALTATDAHGCKVSDSAIITQPIAFVVTVPDTLIMKFGDHMNLPVDVNPTGTYTYQWTRETTLSCGNCADPVSYTPQTTTYTVTVTDISGCADTITFTLFVVADKQLFIPNVFSPNGDGINDILQVHTFGDNFFHLLIFDRIGEKVFESFNTEQGWDGKFNGQYVPPGVFTYHVVVNYLDGDAVQRNGTITVLR